MVCLGFFIKKHPSPKTSPKWVVSPPSSIESHLVVRLCSRGLSTPLPSPSSMSPGQAASWPPVRVSGQVVTALPEVLIVSVECPLKDGSPGFFQGALLRIPAQRNSPGWDEDHARPIYILNTKVNFGLGFRFRCNIDFKRILSRLWLFLPKT